MIKIDHVLDAIRPHYEALLDCFLEEQRKHNYRKLSDNPYYEELKALISAMNLIRKHLGWETITLKKEVEFYL